MKHLKTIFACLLMAVLSIGQMWATDYELMLTLDVTQGAPSGTTSTGLTNETLLSYLQGAAPATTDIISASLTGNVYKGKGSGGAGVPQECLKIGKASGAGSITFAIANTYDNVTKVEITGYGWKTSTAVSVNSSDAQSPATALSEVTFSYEISGSKSITINSASSAFCATEIKLYKTKSGGTPTPSLSVSPTSINFGTVEKGTSVSSEAVAVTFANLTGSVTYSGLSSPFTASGAVSATGDEITIAANTSNVGEYEQTLIVTSAADSKSATVTVTMNVVEPFDGLQLTFPDDGSEGSNVSSYTTSWSATKGTQSWSIYGFNTNKWGWNPAVIKTGRKNNSGTAQPLTATIVTQVTDHAVGDIVVTVDAVTVAQITSHKLYVADNSSFDDAIEIDGDPATIAVGNITYTVPAANRANDLYYKLEYATAGTASGNGTLTISKITYAYATAAPQKQSTGLAYADELKNHLVKVGASYEAPTLTNPDNLTGITYASSDDAIVEVNETTGALTIKAAGKAVITASRAEDATYKAGTASYTIYVATEAGTAADPLTEASAKALIDLGCTLSAYVKGTVANVGDLNTTYGSITLTLTDGLKFFGMLNTGGTQFETNPFVVEDVVTAVGNLKKYNSTYELDTNCELVERIPAAVVLESISINGTATALEYTDGQHFDPAGLGVTGHYSDASTAPITEGVVWAFDPDPLTEGTTSVSVTATAGGKTSAAFVVDGLTVAGAAPLSPWATVYTSNITLSTEGGTSASAAKVKFYGEEGDGYDAIKAGTGSAQGAVVVNVPAGATALHLHAYGWKGEALTLSITAPAGVTVTPSSITLNSNDGITSNSPFTLTEGSTPQTDAYYALTLSGNTAAADLTFTATSGKRFVLFGVNQVGAVTLESISVSGTATALEYNDGDHFSPAGLGVTGHYSDASTAPITEGIVWAFDPDPLTEGTTSVSVTATASGKTSAAFVVDGLTVAGAAPLSPWATTWTSNLDDITGSKVKFYGEETEYAALKAGSSGTAGSATLNIPAQATELHLHAYGWNSEDVTLSITAPAGVTVTPASITLNRNSGFASNSPFTLAEGSTPQTDAYYALSLSGNTDAIELTITATEGKRFLLFGVNQEGGQLPVLESIEIKGDLTTKTGYKAGDALNLDGLTVEATYSIGGVAQTPVDITDKLGDGLTLTYDPLVENQTEVTITATYGDKSDDITITGLDPVASADPKIYVSTLNVDFGSVEVGEAVPANETVTVTLTNVAAATATLDGEGFSISPSTLTASGDITVSVVASTASAANYSATLTISDDATENPADSKVITLSFAVTEPVVNEEYELVSDVNTLAAGDQIIIVAENAGTYYTLDGSITSQYFPSTAVSISAGIITAPSTSAIILGKDEDNWTMSMGGQLIGATAAKKASLGNNDASNTWTIAIAENVATITNTTTTYGSLQFNYNNGSNSRFLNYTSTQTAVAIYKKVAAPAPEYETVRSGLEINRYYTVCLPKKVTAIKGASFWTLNNKSQDGATAYLEEETNNLPFAAGTPFIIQATAENLEVVYEGAATEDAGTNGALHGTLVYMDAAALAAAGPGVYMLFSNELRPVGENNHLDANRAYVLLSELNPVAEAPQSAPGKRVRAMPMQPQTATGIEDLNASEKPMKMMINGQIFILRGEKMYDTTGRLVK